ncbi:MAG TPA: hypothetical protein VLT84_01530 [Acidobacteriota bacterium]|nr:hypothetical protein [Acidobacteriota bacterium]
MSWLVANMKWVMLVSGVLVFIGLVLAQGGAFAGHQAGLAVAVDSVFVLLFAAYLIGSSRRR